MGCRNRRDVSGRRVKLEAVLPYSFKTVATGEGSRPVQLSCDNLHVFYFGGAHSILVMKCKIHFPFFGNSTDPITGANQLH